MKTTVKLAALAAMLFSFALAGEAMADTLGDTLARELCRVSKGKTSSYMLSQQELLLWNGQAVSGSYTTTSAGTAYSYYFKKDANQDGAATCDNSSKQQVVPSPTSCTRYGVTKSGSVLTRGHVVHTVPLVPYAQRRK